MTLSSGTDLLPTSALQRTLAAAERRRKCLRDMDVQIHDIHPQFTGDIITRLKTATQQDEELTVLREVIFQGWLDQRKEAPAAVHEYWNYRDELAIEDG